MPLPDTKVAPEKFRGRYTRIRSFLIHYELLLEQHNVHSDKDKCDLIIRYCSRKVTEFIQALTSYGDKKWDKLKEDLLKYYDADLDNKKYRIGDLIKLVKACKEKKLKNLSAWREYGRKFITIGGWLLKKKKLTDEEYATYYWNGIPKLLRIKLENRLLARDPVRSLATPFKIDEINSAAEALLQRDRFDMNFAGSDEEDESGNEEDDESDETSDSEDELRTMRRRVRKHAKYAKKKRSVSDSDESEEEDARTARQRAAKNMKRKVNGKDEPEVEKLIRQLNTMSLDDPGYAGLVFRALKIDPDVMKVIRPPVFVTKPTIPSPPQFPRAAQPFSGFRPQNAPHTTPSFSAPRSFDRRLNHEDDRERCYACGAMGHRMSQCHEMQELTAKNVVMKNGSGRYVYGDGRPIRRLPGETIVDAIRHSMTDPAGHGKLESHLIQVVNEEEDGRTRSEYYGNIDSDTSESETYSSDESCDEHVISAAVMSWDHEEPIGMTYPVTRTERTASAKRREAMEAEYTQSKRRKPSDKPQSNGTKENAQATAPIERPIRPLPAAPRMQVPVPVAGYKNEMSVGGKNGKVSAPRGPVPVEARRPEYDGSRDNEIMEDLSNRHAQPKARESKEAPGRSNPKEGIPAGQQQEKHPRQSEVAAQVKPVGVLNQVLNTRIDLAIGEVLGISKELSALLGDKIKPKSTKLPVPIAASLPIATSVLTKDRGPLIQLHMQCDGRPITAIIDTGSQLNIVNKNICEDIILRPIDNTGKISIADANGGQGKLEGMIANVPLHCGEVATSANLYVGAHVPFELLLGRPWQRGNFVSIDERQNGTYLLFKDPKTLKPRYEILVAIDKTPAGIQYELPVWDLPEPERSVSFHISIDKAPEEPDPIDGPTTRFKAPITLSSPFPDSLSSVMTHTPPPQYQRQDGSISFAKGTRRVVTKALTFLAGNDGDDISSMDVIHRNSPERISFPPCSMSLGVRLEPTQAQPGPAIAPLTSRPLLRLDSEVLVAALADVPFLKRTENLHPLILSTADGVLLGNSVDPSGHKHADYTFLHAGLFDLSHPPYTVTPASAFVRLYPDLCDGPPQPWILPYISNPPSQVMVSTLPHNASQITECANEIRRLIKQFEAGDEKVVLPTQQQTKVAPTSSSALPPVVKGTVATGEIVQNTSKRDESPAETFSRLASPGTVVPTNSTSPPARAFGSDITDSSSSTSNSYITPSNVIPPPRIVVSSTRVTVPPPTPSSDESTDEDYSSTSTRIGSSSEPDSDADGEMDMEVEAEMEWEDLQTEIKNELMREVEKDSRERDDDKENNDGNFHKISPDLYSRLFDSYCQITGEAPSDATMKELQRYYLLVLERGIIPFIPRSALVKREPSPTDAPPGIANRAPQAPSPLVANPPHQYYPTTSSPLVLNPPHPYIPPEPTAVYMVQRMSSDSSSETTSEDSSSPPPLVRNDGVIINAAVIEKKFTVSAASPDVEMATSQQDLPATAPASPVPPEDRMNRFQRPRKVGKEELIRNLQLEAAQLREQLESMESTEASIHENYYQRLTETLEKIQQMESDRVGELESNQLYLAGLMHIIRLVEAIASTPLPHNSPLMVPAAAPPATVEEALSDIIKDTDPTDIEEYCAIRGESGTTTYNQGDDAKIPQCPSQPASNVDPRSIPIESRPYFKGGANDFIKKAGGVKRHLYVDIRSLTIVENPTHVPTAFLRHFTELYGQLEPLIFPGRLAPVHDWPFDVPDTYALTYQERVEELRKARREVEMLYQETTRTLTKSQIAECLRPHITLHKRISEDSPQLSPIKVDRMYFWQRLHPIWNPLLKPVEAAFVRGAIYVYYGTGRRDKAEELERLLRTPHYDDWETRELVALGALDSKFRENEALSYFRALDDEHWEYHANEEAFRKAATSILDVAEHMEDGEEDDGSDKMVNIEDSLILEDPAIAKEPSCNHCTNTDCAGFPIAGFPAAT